MVMCVFAHNSLELLGSSLGNGIFIFSFIIFVLFQMDQGLFIAYLLHIALVLSSTMPSQTCSQSSPSARSSHCHWPFMPVRSCNTHMTFADKFQLVPYFSIHPYHKACTHPHNFPRYFQIMELINSQPCFSVYMSAVGTLHYQLLGAQCRGFQMLASVHMLHLPTIKVQVF